MEGHGNCIRFDVNTLFVMREFGAREIPKREFVKKHHFSLVWNTGETHKRDQNVWVPSAF
jgi:hypothetical protein